MDTWKIGWGISNRCNMGCKFCYSRKARKEPNYEGNIKKGLEFILNNKERIDSINFGTGEPTVEPEMFDICYSLRREAPHISIGITTNGSLAEAVKDPYRMDVFRRCIDDVDISLDYGNRKDQDASRNFDGAFAMAIRSLELCKKYGKNASVVNALHKYNCTRENIDSLIRIARLYDASLRINIYRPTVDFDYVLSYKQLKDIITYLVHTYEIESLADPLFASLFAVPCPAGDPVGRCSFRIIPNGYISPSTYLLGEEWRACRIDEIEKIDDLHEFEAFEKVVDAPIPEECSGCYFREKCRGGVIDRRSLWYEDLSERDPYCPLRNEDSTEWLELSGEPIMSQSRKSFVHDGYLPTLIFGSNINERAMNAWDKIYDKEVHGYGATSPESIVLEIAAELDVDGASIIDLGSGLGRNGLALLEKNANVTFVDDSKLANDGLLAKCFANYIDRNYSVVDSDISSYLEDCKDESADGILAIHVLSHGTPEEIEKQYISHIYRVLKKGGCVAMTLPSLNDKRCREMKEAEDGIASFAFTDGEEKGIVHTFYSEQAVNNLLSEFKIVQSREVVQDSGTAHWYMLLKK